MAKRDTTIDLLHEVLVKLAVVVGGIGKDQLHDPTPCSEFDVEDLRTHVLGWLTTFAAGFADVHGRAPSEQLSDYVVSSDPGGEVTAAAQLMDQALRSGAAERPLDLGEHSMPGELALGMILWEYQVHGWDLAKATRQSWDPPRAASAESLAFAPGMLTEDYQGEGKAFAKPVRVLDDSTALDRLLGLSGRDPSWSRP
ncbi:MAG: TIGR03086 family metal-binding protein [Acidimicrobiales bacterium]